MELMSVGRFVATFGLNGELVLKHALGKKTALKDVKVLFIEEQRGSRLPYFIETAKAKNHEEIFIKLEGINTKEAAQKLTAKAIWLNKADFDNNVGASSAIGLIGFIMLEDGKVLGRVEEVIEQPHQILCTIKVDGKEALIPLHEESLIKIDRKKKEVHVTLPEGLLEIYLG